MEKWINQLISEKNLDTETIILANGPSGLNQIPLQMVIDGIIAAPAHEQRQIKNILVQIDFRNGDIMHFFRHLAQALAA